MHIRLACTLLIGTLLGLLSACATPPTEVALDCDCERQAAEAPEPDASEESADSPIEMADFDTPVTPLPRNEELSLGPADAPVQIFVYLDVACPYSKDAWEAIAAIVKENSPHVRAALRHFPVKSGSDAAQVHLEAAARLDHDKAVALLQSLFEDPPSGMGFLFGDRSADQVIAENIGRAHLDQRVLESVAEQSQLRYVVTSDAEEARRLGFTGTPGLVINGVRVYGALPKENYQLLVDAFMTPQSAEARNQ